MKPFSTAESRTSPPSVPDTLSPIKSSGRRARNESPSASRASKRPKKRSAAKTSTARATKPIIEGHPDEFQQVTLASFVARYRVKGMGPGGDVYYQPDFLPLEISERWYAEIDRLDTYHPMLKMYGRTFPQSRSIAAYSTTPDAKLKYSGTEITMHHPFPPALAEMQARLEAALGVKFNHCMLNRYEDGSVYIGKHSDNLNNLVIASISLGAERTFIMSPRLPSRSAKPVELDEGEMEELEGRKPLKWKLASGSLVVMQGRTQEFWKHEIPKEASVKHGRISLTFRQLV